MSEDVKYCPECGKQVGAGAAMCPSCGHMFSRQVNTGMGVWNTAPVLKEGLMMIFIGLLIELASPALGFAGASSIISGIGAFIGIGGLIVEMIGFAKIRHVNHHFNKAWNYYIGAIACTAGYAIATLIMTFSLASALYTGGYGVVIAMLLISIGFTIALAVLDIFRIRELMNGCAEVAEENGDSLHAGKCSFAGKFYAIARGILLAITVLILIFTLVSFGSAVGGGYAAAAGAAIAIFVFGVFSIIISCVLLAAQILLIIRVYQTYSKCKAAAYSGADTSGGNAQGFNNASSNNDTNTDDNAAKAEQKSPEGARSVHERVDELERKMSEQAEHVPEASSGVAKEASAATAGAAGVAAAFGAAGSSSVSGSVYEDDEDPVTMLKRPDAEIIFVAGSGSDDEDEEKTVILEASHPTLVRLSTGETIEISGKSFILGRSREKADYRIENPAVSIRHAKLELVGDKLFAEDLNSSNHTYINGELLESGTDNKRCLSSGDILKLAEEEFRVEIGAAVPQKESDQTYKPSHFSVRFSSNEDEMQIGKTEFTIGRKGGNADLIITDQNTVGRCHAKIRADEINGKIYLKDEDSANGTFLNGKKLDKGEEVEIKNNDEIKLSDVTVRFYM